MSKPKDGDEWLDESVKPPQWKQWSEAVGGWVVMPKPMPETKMFKYHPLPGAYNNMRTGQAGSVTVWSGVIGTIPLCVMTLVDGREIAVNLTDLVRIA